MFQPHSRQIICAIVMVLAAALLAGCGGEEEDDQVKAAPPPPPPPTPEEIAAKIVSDLKLNAPMPAPGSRMPKQESTNLIQSLQTAKTQQSATVDGKRALQIVSRKIGSRLRALERIELWEHVLAYINADKILNPDSHKFDDARNRAIAELRKPLVTIQGYFFDGKAKETAVFMDFYLPIEKETHNHQVRPGEEFYGLKLISIIGNNQGVTMEYLETTQTFDVLNKSSRN